MPHFWQRGVCDVRGSFDRVLFQKNRWYKLTQSINQSIVTNHMNHLVTESNNQSKVSIQTPRNVSPHNKSINRYKPQKSISYRIKQSIESLETNSKKCLPTQQINQSIDRWNLQKALNPFQHSSSSYVLTDGCSLYFFSPHCARHSFFMRKCSSRAFFLALQLSLQDWEDHEKNKHLARKIPRICKMKFLHSPHGMVVE